MPFRRSCNIIQGMNENHSRSELVYRQRWIGPAIRSAIEILKFIDSHRTKPRAIRGILIHAGRSVKWLHSKILTVPWWWIGS